MGWEGRLGQVCALQGCSWVAALVNKSYSPGNQVLVSTDRMGAEHLAALALAAKGPLYQLVSLPITTFLALPYFEVWSVAAGGWW